MASMGLPVGWEKAVTPDGTLFFIDHNNHLTTFEPPEHPATPRSHDQAPYSPRQLKAPTARRDGNSRITMRGWLHRQEGKAWKRRWCVLADYGLFFYKDDTESTSLGSILLPSFRISECIQTDNISKRYAFKAEHDNLITNYFATDRNEDMNRWIGQLQSAASLKAGLSSPNVERNNNTIKLIPKSPIMTWDDGVSPVSPTSLSSSQFGPGFQSTPNTQQPLQGYGPKNSQNGGPGYRSPPERYPGTGKQYHPSSGQDYEQHLPHQQDSHPSSADQSAQRDSYPQHPERYRPSPESDSRYWDRPYASKHSVEENLDYPQRNQYSKFPEHPNSRGQGRLDGYQQPPEQPYSRLDNRSGELEPQRLSYSEDRYGSQPPREPRNPVLPRQTPSGNTDHRQIQKDPRVPAARSDRRERRQRSDDSEPRGRSDDREERSRYPPNKGRGTSDQRDSRSRFPDYPYTDDRNFQESRQPSSKKISNADMNNSQRGDPYPLHKSPNYHHPQSLEDSRNSNPAIPQGSKNLSQYVPPEHNRPGRMDTISPQAYPDRRHRSHSEDRLARSPDNEQTYSPYSGPHHDGNTAADRLNPNFGETNSQRRNVSPREMKPEAIRSNEHTQRQSQHPGYRGQTGRQGTDYPPGGSERSNVPGQRERPHNTDRTSKPYAKKTGQHEVLRERITDHQGIKDRNEYRYGHPRQRDSQSKYSTSKGQNISQSQMDMSRSRNAENMHEFDPRTRMQSSYSQPEISAEPQVTNRHQRDSQSAVSEDSMSYDKLRKYYDPFKNNEQPPHLRDDYQKNAQPYYRNSPVEENRYAKSLHEQQMKARNVDSESPYAVVKRPLPTQKPEPAQNTQQRRFDDRDTDLDGFSSFPSAPAPHSVPDDQYIHPNYSNQDYFPHDKYSDRLADDHTVPKHTDNRENTDSWRRNELSSPRDLNYPPHDGPGSEVQTLTKRSQEPPMAAPHTYVNVYDRSGRPDSLNTSSEGPDRPPLPALMRHLIVEDIAQHRSPQTSLDYLQAEDNLEQRMNHSPYFQYPSVSSLDNRARGSADQFKVEREFAETRNAPVQGQSWNSKKEDTGDNGAEQITVSGAVLDNNSQLSHNATTDTKLFQNDSADTQLSHNSTADMQQSHNSTADGHPHWRDSLVDDKRKSASSIEIQNINQGLDLRTFEEDIDMIEKQQPLESDFKLSPNSSENSYIHANATPSFTDDNESERYSAFRPIDDSERTMNSLQRLERMNSLKRGETYDKNKKNDPILMNKPVKAHSENGTGEPDSTDSFVKNNTMEQIVSPFSEVSSQDFDSLGKYPSIQHQQYMGPELGHMGREPGHMGPESGYMGPERSLGIGPIQTVKEEPDMSDADIIQTELPKMAKDALNTRGLRMSINAGDLIGKTHDELVLLLIQLRRNQSALEKTRSYYRSRLEDKRPAEHEYRRQIMEDAGPVDSYLESEHAQYAEFRKHCEEVENKLEVYKPLVNLVSNMVTMGSLYGGDNQMMATQYRKHLLSPDQYIPPKKMLEFSRKHQEDTIVKEMEDEVIQLSKEEVDLEDKVDRLCQLDRLIQEHSFKVTTFREDKELLEKALHGIVKQQDLNRDNPRDLEHLTHQQRTIEKELTLIMHQLAEASKDLEEVTAENNKVEHEVTLLRSKVNTDLTRSRSAPSLSSENLRVKMKMEKDLAKVQNMMAGLTKEGARLSEAMNTLRRSSSGAKLATALSKDNFESVPIQKDKVISYMETDLDTLEATDLGQVDTSPSQPTRTALTFDSIGSQSNMVVDPEGDAEGENQWDIGEADENTKRFYGLIPKEKPKVLTVRDVKRQAGQRKERDKQRKGPEDFSTDSTLPEYSWKQQPSQSQPSQRGEVEPVGRHWSTLLSQPAPTSMTLTSTTPSFRRSSLHLMTPRPYVKFQDHSPSNSKETSSVAIPSDSRIETSSSLTTFQSSPLYSQSMQIDNTHVPPVSYTQQTSGLYNVKKTPRGRYMTISSSQPIKMETTNPQPLTPHSAAGDLMTNQPGMPDIVRSSTTTADQMDESMIDREILYFPQKVEIPERYMPESDDEDISAEEQMKRQEKADKIKQLLAQQSVHSMSQPDVSKVAGQIHERVEQEKEKRAELLAVNQQLAQQVKQRSRKAAAERRKTWSGGSASKGTFNGIPGFTGEQTVDDQFIQSGYRDPRVQVEVREY
ncbi:hypothetical protein ScPMuIL_015353 [Solemya velum]